MMGMEGRSEMQRNLIWILIPFASNDNTKSMEHNLFLIDCVNKIAPQFCKIIAHIHWHFSATPFAHSSLSFELIMHTKEPLSHIDRNYSAWYAFHGTTTLKSEDFFFVFIPHRWMQRSDEVFVYCKFCALAVRKTNHAIENVSYNQWSVTKQSKAKTVHAFVW